MIRRCGSRTPGRVAAAGFLLLACGALSACPQNPTMTKQELRNMQEYATYRETGTSIIEGQVLVHLPSGEEIYGGNCQVRLLPVSTATTQYMNSIVLPGAVSRPRKELESVSWLAIADTEGRFRFTELPAGEYYVTCPMAWVQDGKTHQGIAFATAEVEENAAVSVVVTRGTGQP
jgi:hypothetical protein